MQQAREELQKAIANHPNITKALEWQKEMRKK